MFNYFGSKARLAPTYQAPKHDLIVEPFAGAAGYSMYWLQRRSDLRCFLLDSDPLVVDMWETLLAMNPADLWNYPPPEPGKRTHDLVYLACTVSSGSWGRRARGDDYQITDMMAGNFPHRREIMAQTLSVISGRVDIKCADYRDAPYTEATWFIDPPYQLDGEYYVNNQYSLDFQELGDWCTARRGQVMVCESLGANWLPFDIHGSNRTVTGSTSTEVVWYSEPEPTLFSEMQ